MAKIIDTHRCYICARSTCECERVGILGAMPDDVLHMIWCMKRREEAASTIQRAVRDAIGRAGGDPWDLPPLVDAEPGRLGVPVQYLPWFWQQSLWNWHV